MTKHLCNQSACISVILDPLDQFSIHWSFLSFDCFRGRNNLSVDKAMGYGRVVIVTNAAHGWVEMSCAAFMPGCLAGPGNISFEFAFLTCLFCFLSAADLLMRFAAFVGRTGYPLGSILCALSWMTRMIQSVRLKAFPFSKKTYTETISYLHVRGLTDFFNLFHLWKGEPSGRPRWMETPCFCSCYRCCFRAWKQDRSPTWISNQ